MSNEQEPTLTSVRLTDERLEALVNHCEEMDQLHSEDIIFGGYTFVRLPVDDLRSLIEEVYWLRELETGLKVETEDLRQLLADAQMREMLSTQSEARLREEIARLTAQLPEDRRVASDGGQ